MNPFVWLLFGLAALMEVGGDSLIRRGLLSRNTALILAGCTTLAAYGVLVNLVKWEFFRLLGVYVGFFALVSVLFGWLAFHEKIPRSTWLGLGLIMAGSLVIQFGRSRL